MANNLPFEFQKIKAINPSFLVIYGPPKIGKTPSLLKLKDNLLLDLEDRAKFFEGNYVKVPILNADGSVNSLKSLEYLEQIGKKIIESGKPYKSITIDTGTVLNEWTDDFAKLLYLNSPVCAREYKRNPDLLNSITDLPNMAGWNWTRIAYKKWLNLIRSWADTTIMILHVRDKFLSDKDGNSVQSVDVSLVGKLKEITMSRADAIGYLYRISDSAENGKPNSKMRINFNAGNEVVSGSTCAHLRGQDFEFYPEKNPDDWLKIFVPE